MNLTEYFLNDIKLDSHYEKHVAKDATSFTLTPDRKGYIKLPPMTKEEYNTLANNILKISNNDKDILYSYTDSNSTNNVKNYVKIKLWLDNLIIDKIDKIFEDRLEKEKEEINSNKELSEEEKKVIISSVEKKLSWDPNDYCEYTAFGKSVRNGKEVNLTYYLIPKKKALINFKSQKSSKQFTIVSKEVSTNKSIQTLKTKEDNIRLHSKPIVVNDDEKIYNYEIVGEKEYVDKFLEKIKQYVISIQDSKEKETNDESLNEELLFEKKRSELLQKGKQGAYYKDQSKGRNRFERKRLSRVATTVAQYNRIDMNTFFKKDELIVNVPVQGETNNYLVTIKFSGVLAKVRELLKNGGKFEFRIIANALTQVFNTGDIKIHCTCLHPDTKINLLDGTIPTVKELKERFDNGEELWVYSTDENGDFKPGKVSNVFITKKTTKFIRIYLDNDKYIDTTPDHLYLKRDGNYVEAQDLQVGDSLMPLYFSMNKKGYQLVKINSTNRYNSVYKLVAQELYSELIKQKKEEALYDESVEKMHYDVAIHHKDFNKQNNNPSNLKVMTSYEHWKYHADLCGPDRRITEKMRETARQNAYKRNANPTTAMIESRKVFQEKGRLRNYDEDRKQQQSVIMSKVAKDYWDNLTPEQYEERCKLSSEVSKKAWRDGKMETQAFKDASKKRGEFLHSKEIEELSAQGVRTYWTNLTLEEKEKRDAISRKNVRKAIEKTKGVSLTKEHRDKIRNSLLLRSDEQVKEDNKKIAQTKIKKVLLYMIENHIELTDDNFNKTKKMFRKEFKYSCSRLETAGFNDIADAIKFFKLNHKVVKIEYITLEEPIEVYDITVDKYSNFLVDSSVILHNCDDFRYRFGYWLTRNGDDAGPYENRPSDKTNPHDTLGSGCKHVLLVLSNMNWLMKVASVINNYIHYAEIRMPRNYNDYIFPALYGYTQTSLFRNTSKGLGTSQQTLNRANKMGRTRGQYKTGNVPYNKGTSSKPQPGQMQLDLDYDNDKNEPIFRKN